MLEWACKWALARVRAQVVEEVVQLDERLPALVDVALEERLQACRPRVAVLVDSESLRRGQ